MTIALSNLRYADAANVAIDMDVAGWVEGETIPFTYHPGDVGTLSLIVWQMLGQGGYTIAPYEPPVPDQAEYQAAIQRHVDVTARERSYNDGVSCASYKDSTNAQWAAEAVAFIGWRDSVWTYAYAELARVQNGERTQPTVAEFVAELPTIVWPQ